MHDCGSKPQNLDGIGPLTTGICRHLTASTGRADEATRGKKKKMTVDGPETERNIAAAASATTATTATTKMERQCHNLFIDRL